MWRNVDGLLMVDRKPRHPYSTLRNKNVRAIACSVTC